jgi:hypothetical protein
MYNNSMIAVINFIAIFVVSTVVAYHVYETINKYKVISTKLTELDDANAATRSSIVKTKTDLTNNINETSSKLNDKVQATENSLSTRIENTESTLTSELKTTQDGLQAANTRLTTADTSIRNEISASNKKLDNFFTTLSQQVTTNRLRVNQQTDINNNVNINNGKINITKSDPGAMVEKVYSGAGDRYGIGQFPNGSMRMYTASTHKPATAGLSIANPNGTLNDVLTVTTDNVTNVHGDMDLRGKLHFGRLDNNSDPYILEKRVTGPNNSSLRMTINDDSDEAFEIWGNSCAAGNCRGDGLLQHRFQANGDASHAGNVRVAKKLLVNRSTTDRYPNWGDGLHTWDLYANGTIGAGTNGAVAAYINNAGRIAGKELCIDDVCLNSQELNNIKTRATQPIQTTTTK